MTRLWAQALAALENLHAAAPCTLGPGETIFHSANQPHALATTDQPLLAYVLWRDNFGQPPVLTPKDRLSASRPPKPKQEH